MSNPIKTLVIFDLDFTLIDNSFTICKAFNHALSHFQIKPVEKELIIKKIGIPLKEMFLDYLDDEKAEKAIYIFRKYYSIHFFEGVKFIPGAVEILKKLKELGYRIALLTSKKTDLAIKLLEYVGIKNYFEFILGEQKEFKLKPDPTSIKYLFSKFSEIDETFMIGDHVVDCITARNAGIKFIGVLTGNTSLEELQKCAGKNAILLKSIKELNPSRHLI
ncbi:MAG: HAD family hydrolase [Promethearchaeota archaeon]